MTQTTNRILDELAKVLTNAAGAAQGVRGEVDTMLRGQAERILNDLDMVNREEFEAVRDMAALAREENELLKERIAELETKVAALAKPAKPASRTRTTTAKSKTRAKPTAN
jgi:hypothetical protein